MKEYLLLFIILSACLSCGKRSAEIKVETDQVYPRYRLEATPKNGKTIAVNPMPLLWKPENRTAKYVVELSQSKNFSDAVVSDTIQWAMYSPHKALKQGKWFWRYNVIGDSVNYVSDTFEFRVDGTSRMFETPTVEEFLAAIPGGHPKIYVNSDMMSAFRSRNKGTSEAEYVISKADSFIGAPLPVEKPTQWRDTTGLKGFEMDMMLVYMYHLYGDVVKEPVEFSSLAYLLTGEEKYRDVIVRHSIALSEMDPQGHATREDFNSSSVMLAMAQAYDTAYDILSQEQKVKLLEAIKVRADHIYKNTLINRFEAHSMDNHIWQHVLRRFFMTGIAVSDVIPEARDWIAYCYEVWNCRFPINGGDDGAAPDGNSYFPVNFETFIYMPQMIRQLTGVNYFDHPWYLNVADYMLYSFPVNGISTQFGDEHEYMRSRPERYFGFIDAIARETDNPVMNWYLNEWIGGDVDILHTDVPFLQYRLLAEKPLWGAGFRSPEDLPLSRVFKDTGIAVMRSDLSDTSHDFMASFTSATFGATGHAHANHNSYSINYKGEALLGSSGYYSHFSDRHNLLHYRNSYGHNTVIADGKSQAIGENGYGWIARFADGGDFSYVLGDASNSYKKVTSPFWIDRFERVGLEPSEELGFGDAGVTKFRRHFIRLLPSYVVIFDELESVQPIEWQVLTHSRFPIEQDGNGFITSNETGVLYGIVSGSSDIDFAVTDEFREPADNWRSLYDKKTGEVLPFNKQWHLSHFTKDNTDVMRFVTILTVGDSKDEIIKPEIVDGHAQLGKWTIDCRMSTDEKLSFAVYDTDGHGIYYNYGTVKGYKPKFEASTLIVTANAVEELIDTLPESMK